MGLLDVINMSLGIDEQSDGTDTITKVINAIVANGVSVVVSAGNSGGNCLGRVAAAELAVTVAASDDRGTVDREDDRIAEFSTSGPRIDFNPALPTVGQLKPDIAAPGVNSTSAQGDTAGSYHALDGTSQAAPYVAGAIALLLDLEPGLPPGSMKELIKRTAYITPQHAALGPDFPAIDSAYQVNWGFGLLDVYEAASALAAGITDVTFTACAGCGGNANCDIPGADYANSTDIKLATDPPIQGEPNTITLFVENRGGSAAEDVVVCVGVKELGAGLNEFYDVGCKVVDIPGLTTVSVDFPWTPTLNGHQCIQATVNYAFDTEFCNNQTQRNTSPVASASVAMGQFRVENPFNEPATIVLTPQFAGGNDSIRMEILGKTTLRMGPQDCAVLTEVAFVPSPATPIGERAIWRIDAVGFPDSADGKPFELSGVQFEVEIVAAGLERAYSIGRHGPSGKVRLPLNLTSVPRPTSDPRAGGVSEVLAVFNVTVGPSEGDLTPEMVAIESAVGNEIPRYTVSFETGGNFGKELTILFEQPLKDQDRYRFSFGRFVDTDGDPLKGDSDFELRTLEGDANDSGAVTSADIPYVRGRLNMLAEFGASSRADCNLNGAVTPADISFVRGRLNNTAP
jgi:hypothetical protein